MTAPSQASTDYVTETGYVWGYFDEMSPHALCSVARLHGNPTPRLDGPFTYLELGCGFGLTALALAACHPQATFHAVDFNEQHIASARQLQAATGVSNLTYHRASFADMLEVDTPQIDFITLHGVYSWVSAEVRAQICALIERKLKVGGLVYISYNALPGWGPTLPFRQMLLSYAQCLEGTVLERTRRGLEYLKFLRDHDSAYFHDNPKASRQLDALLAHDLRYVVHEYMNGDWNAFYFHEVEADMRGCGLQLAGDLPLSRGFMDLCVPPQFHALLRSAETRSVYETHRDFVLDAKFRRDVYTRPAPDAEVAWDDVTFGLAPRVDTIALEVALPFGKATLNGPAVHALRELLASAPQRLSALAAALPELTRLELLRGLLLLCATGQVRTYAPGAASAPLPRPLSSESDAKATVSSDGSPLRLTNAFNRAILRERLLVDGTARLASEAWGCVVPVNMLEGLTILATDAGAGDAEGWVIDFLAAQGKTLLIEAKPAPTPEAARSFLTGEMAAARQRLLPQLTRLGILG